MQVYSKNRPAFFLFRYAEREASDKGACPLFGEGSAFVVLKTKLRFVNMQVRDLLLASTKAVPSPNGG